MDTLRKVMDNELREVNEWLESYLPESWGLYCLTRCVLNGQWSGQSFYTLGWPDIRGVVTGEVEANHPCPDFCQGINNNSLYAPKDEDVEIILNLKEVDTWTKPQFKSVMSERILKLMEKVARARGLNWWHDVTLVTVFRASPGDIKLRPCPTGFTIGPVKREEEINYSISTRQYDTPHFDQYLRAVVDRFPSVCVTDDQDRCVSCEFGFEDGSTGYLYTKQEARRKGLARAVISHIADEYRKLNLDYFTCVVVGNTPSEELHAAMGFTPVGTFGYTGILF